MSVVYFPHQKLKKKKKEQTSLKARNAEQDFKTLTRAMKEVEIC